MKTINKRTTIYIDPQLHRALRIKAAETDGSISRLVEKAIKMALAEDAIDLAAYEDRKHEPRLTFEEVAKKLRKNGKI
jgi:predicted transcriptional regulator